MSSAFDEMDGFIEQLSVETEQKVLERGGKLVETLKTPGWKIIEGIMNELADSDLLIIQPGRVANMDIKDLAYVSGQINAMKVLKKSIERQIYLRDQLLKRSLDDS